MTALAFDTMLVFASGARVNICGEDHQRAERLFRLASTLDRNGAIPNTMVRLFERAGTLRVYWSAKPTDMRLLRTIYSAWSNECENIVWHYVTDGERAHCFMEYDGGDLQHTAPNYHFHRPPAPASVG